MGDVVEEWSRRRAHGREAGWWLMAEVCAAARLWLRYRSQHSALLRDAVAASVSFGVVLCVLEVANRPTALTAVRTLDGFALIAALWGANLGALVVGGGCVGLVRRGAGWRPVAGLVALAWVYPLVVLGPVSGGTNALGAGLWAVAVAVAIMCGFSAARRWCPA